MDITNLLILALFIETVVNWLKPIWDKNAPRITAAEIVSMCIGVVVAVLAKINMMESFVSVTHPVLIYLLYACTGVGLGRGPSVLYDAWQKLRAQAKT